MRTSQYDGQRACPSLTSFHHKGADDMADRISPQDVRARQDAGADPVVIDVRDPDQYAAGHVAGALSIPIAELPGKLAELGRDHQIITYCNGGTRCERAATLQIGRAHV